MCINKSNIDVLMHILKLLMGSQKDILNIAYNKYCNFLGIQINVVARPTPS